MRSRPPVTNRSHSKPRRRPRSGGSWVRKNMVVDQNKLDRAKSILGAATETAAVDAALDLVSFRAEVLAGIEKLVEAGGLKLPRGL